MRIKHDWLGNSQKETQRTKNWPCILYPQIIPKFQAEREISAQMIKM